MNRPAFLGALVVAATLAAAPAVAQDLTGEWELTSQTQRGAMTMTLDLVQDGETLTGTITMLGGGRRGGGGGGGGREVEITDGKVDGNSFSFTMTLEMRGNSFTQSYSGTWEGDEMEGQIQGGRGGGRPFSGKRAG